MDYNVHVFINGKEVNSADLPNYVITNRYIDMIIKEIKEKTACDASHRRSFHIFEYLFL